MASRTKSEWAQNLLDQFDLREIFDYVEIFPGDKKQHFANLKSASGFDYGEIEMESLAIVSPYLLGLDVD